MNVKDTIAAISTPPGKGGVALLRVSGDEAVTVAERVFFPKNKKKLSAKSISIIPGISTAR